MAALSRAMVRTDDATEGVVARDRHHVVHRSSSRKPKNDCSPSAALPPSTRYRPMSWLALPDTLRGKAGLPL